MTGARWLITGASSGLGRALAEAALERGGSVAATFRSDAQAETFETLAPGRAFGLRIDLADSKAIPAMIDEAAAIFAINFFAPLAIIQTALPHLRAAGAGRIVNIASMAALQGNRGLGLYAASKAALAALSEVVDIETGQAGIRAISVEATAFRTAFAGAGLRRAERTLPPYAAMREEMDAGFARSNGAQPNDPARGAAALLRLCDLPDPPRHFALGWNAADRAGEILRGRIAEYEGHSALGRATAFTG